MSHRAARRALAASVLMLMSACASISSTTSAPISHGEGRVAHEFPATFALRARVSVKQDDRLDSFTLSWERAHAPPPSQTEPHKLSGVTDTMRVFTPFGAQLALLVINGDGAVLQRGTQRIAAERVATLTENLLGVALDPTSIIAWLRARDPSTVAGWQVIPDRFEVFGLTAMATRVSATRETQTVRIAVDEFVDTGVPPPAPQSARQQ